MVDKKQEALPENHHPPVKAITSLADLPSRDTTVEVVMDDGIYTFPCRALTYARWSELGRLVPYPPPPQIGGTPSGPIYNLNDPGYKAQIEATNEERNYFRLAEFLTIDMPGTTIQERVNALKETLEFGLVNALVQAMHQTAASGKVSVNARTETFRAG